MAVGMNLSRKCVDEPFQEMRGWSGKAGSILSVLCCSKFSLYILFCYANRVQPLVVFRHAKFGFHSQISIPYSLSLIYMIFGLQ